MFHYLHAVKQGKGKKNKKRGGGLPSVEGAASSGSRQNVGGGVRGGVSATAAAMKEERE